MQNRGRSAFEAKKRHFRQKSVNVRVQGTGRSAIEVEMRHFRQLAKKLGRVLIDIKPQTLGKEERTTAVSTVQNTGQSAIETAKRRFRIGQSRCSDADNGHRCKIMDPQ